MIIFYKKKFKSGWNVQGKNLTNVKARVFIENQPKKERYCFKETNASSLAFLDRIFCNRPLKRKEALLFLTLRTEMQAAIEEIHLC